MVAVCFLWHFPASRLGLPLAITLLCEVRTFLEPSPDCYPPSSRSMIRGRPDFSRKGDSYNCRDGESAGWPRHGNDRVEESRDSIGQGAGESQVGVT